MRSVSLFDVQGRESLNEDSVCARNNGAAQYKLRLNKQVMMALVLCMHSPLLIEYHESTAAQLVSIKLEQICTNAV
jgi:hypothetical protein